MIGFPTRTDPFDRSLMINWEGQFENRKPGRNLSNQYLTTGETIATFIVAGQSLSCNSNGTIGDAVYVPTNLSKCNEISIDDGGVYVCKEPMLGSTTALGGLSIFIRLADKLITAGYRQRIVLINVGIGGTSSAQWLNELYPRIVIANERAKAKGFTVNGILWQQGESDNSLGTSQATYVANINGVINAVRSRGLSAPWILAKSTYFTGSTSSAIRAAVDQLANGTNIFVGPDNDSLVGANRVSDNTHMSTSGCDAAGTLWSNSVRSILP